MCACSQQEIWWCALASGNQRGLCTIAYGRERKVCTARVVTVGPAIENLSAAARTRFNELDSGINARRTLLSRRWVTESWRFLLQFSAAVAELAARVRASGADCNQAPGAPELVEMKSWIFRSSSALTSSGTDAAPHAHTAVRTLSTTGTLHAASG